MLRPHNAACCCARPALRSPLPPAALLLRRCYCGCSTRGAPSRPAARTGWHSTDLILDTRRTSSMSLASKCARLRRAARRNFTRREFYAGCEARARPRRRKIRWGIEHQKAIRRGAGRRRRKRRILSWRRQRRRGRQERQQAVLPKQRSAWMPSPSLALFKQFLALFSSPCGEERDMVSVERCDTNILSTT